MKRHASSEAPRLHQTVLRMVHTFDWQFKNMESRKSMLNFGSLGNLMFIY